MYFDSLQELAAMAGHGLYVWGCVVFSTLLILLVFGAAISKFKRQYKLTDKLGKLPE